MLKMSIPLFTTVAISLALVVPASAQATEEMSRDVQFWWPETLNLAPLRANDYRSNPYGEDFDYAKAFKSVDLDALKKDIAVTLKNSQDWWPADWGTYGGLMIRMAWHSAGTYRVSDGRGGADGAQQRFLPLNSWPDNVSLDKARRLLWPVKQKYGRNVSWGDLMTLAGNVSLESMGFETIGFAGGRVDDWEADTVYWGAETKWLGNDKRYDKDGKLEKPLAAVQMGLIYVNPEGPNGNSDPLSAAADIRESFGRMAMNDEETVALIAGGHTLGKAHGAKPADCLGPAPADAPIEQQGLGWKNKCGTGTGADAMTSGLEGAWSSTPTAWSTLYLDNLFRFDWKKTKSPAGATQWIPTDESAANMVPDAHDPNKRHAPIMFTTDIALKEDPVYREISHRFLKNPKEFDLAFAKAWFKLTHRDMGPSTRYLGNEVPQEVFIWQDPVPVVDYKLIDAKDTARLKANILKSGLSVPQLVGTAWASASTYRGSDMRGGANGARLQLLPQKDWAVNNPKQLVAVLTTLTKVQEDFNKSLSDHKQVSLADVIVLGGAAGVEQAAKDAGVSVEVPFKPGRSDTSQQMTDVKSFAVLEPTADAFRNYYSETSYGSPTQMMVDKADLLTLSVPEMTALLGGMRVLNTNTGQTAFGVFTDQPGTLDNKFFVNLLDMSTVWSKSAKTAGIYEGRDRATNDLKWTATPVDLIYGSNSELRAIAEAYAISNEQFINAFVAAWSKVMTLDRFDLNHS